jgi:hypothetical protein
MKSIYLTQITRILKSWEYDCQDHDRYESIVNAFMEAKTTKEVNEIIISNLNFIDRLGLWNQANRAKKRIIGLRAAKIKLTDLRYLN